MKSFIIAKLQELTQRHKDLEILLNDPNLIFDKNQLWLLSKEYGQLTNLVTIFQNWIVLKKNISDTEDLLKDDEIHDIAQDDLKKLNIDLINLEKKLILLFDAQDFNNQRGCFLEIRAGTGGNEAALFAGELFRMYSRYAEKNRWNMEIITITHGEYGGYKEIIVKMSHIEAYKKLKFESGGHRVQRVPNTESQGRIHTSSCTVAVIPEAPHTELPTVHSSDLKIDTFRSSGAGGQHVNTTDSAIRITHLPTGIVVACQDERSQHKNKSKALSVLSARLFAMKSQKQQQETSDIRRNLLGTGDRSDRIRTYNFHQSRVTDHRIKLTLYCLNDIIEGNLDILIKALIEKY